MRITSKKAFISKIKEGYRLKKFEQFRRDIYCLTNKNEEITVSISLIKKLKEEGIVDSNWDVHINGI